MKWTDIPGTELLRRVFSEPPDVGSADLHSIELDWNGPKIIISFDLIDQLPDNPPEKWGKFNRCKLILNCSDVSELTIKGIGRKNIGVFDIKKTDEKNYEISFISNSLQMVFSSPLVWVGGPSVYFSE